MDSTNSAVAYVTKICSRSFRLLIRVVIYQIVHIDKQVPKMVVAIFSKSFEGQGQRSKVNAIEMDRTYIY